MSNSIPANTQFVGIAPGIDLVEKKSSLVNDKQAIYTFDELKGGIVAPALESGTEISFAIPSLYNDSDTPATGNITQDLSKAVRGFVQKIYHNDSSEPTYPAEWTLLAGEYVADSLNIIYAEYASPTRVEYWIVNG